ncbi:hypothetical protein KAR52_01450, partial [Candidatus Pacearchaeota archaeon]|nr:hypothetical protein [Candidatus Pacearchaeota archaeon]
YNTSEARSYTIAKATPTLSGSLVATPITYGTAVDYSGSESDSGDNDCYYSLKREGVEIDTESSVEDTTILGAGTWDYNYSTVGGVNYSEGSDFDSLVVEQAMPEGSISIGTSPIIFGTAGDVEGTETNSGDDDVDYKLYRDNVSVDNPDLTTLGVGSYHYIYNATAGVNWTNNASMDEFILTVTQAGDTFEVLLNNAAENLTVTFPQQVNVTVSNNLTTVTIDVNGTTFTSGSNYTLGVGVWFVNVTTAGNQNYTTNESDWYITVNEAMPTGSITGNSPIIFGTVGDVDVIESNTGDDDVGYELYRDNVSVSKPDETILGVGSYHYIYNATAGTNWTNNASMDEFILTVTQAGDTFTTLINGNADNETVTFPQQVNVSVSNNLTTATIDVNGTTFISGSNYTLGVGVWFVNVSTAGNQNYTTNESDWYITVNQGAGEVYAWVNNARSNFTTTNESSQNIWLNATLDVGEGDIELWFNGTLYDSGASPLFNLTNLTLGFYNVTAVYDGNANYSSDREIWWINITDTPSDASPTVSIVYPQNTIYTVNVFQLNYTVSDDYGLDKCWWSINEGVSNETITCGNNVTDLTSIEGSNIWTVWANDSEGQENSDSVTFTKDTIYPSVSLLTESPSDPATYFSGVKYEFNATITDTNLEVVLIEFNGTNYTPSNVVGDIYNFSISDLSEGTYNYYWYVNDTHGNVNNSESGDYIIGKATPAGSISTGTSPINYGTVGDVEGTESNTGDGDVLYKLHREGVEVSNPDTTTLGAGTWNYIYNTSGGQNYSAVASLDTFALTVNQIASSINLTLNGTQGNVTVNQGDSIDLNCSTMTGDSGAFLVLYKDGAIIANETSPLKNGTSFGSVGEENITCVYEGTQNYTTISQTWFVNVTEIPDIILPYFTDNTPQNQTIIYNTDLAYNINATDIIGFDCFTINDTRFKINCSGYLENNTRLGVALYNLNVTINDTSNNLNSSYFWINVTQSGDTFSTLLNGNANNLTVTFPQQVNVSVSNNLTTATIDVNGTTFTSGSNYTLGVGVWFVNVTTAGNQNYTTNESDWYITVNQATGIVYTYLNHSRSNMTTKNNTAIWLNASLIAGDSGAVFTLYNNGTIINSDTSALSNLTAFNTTGLFNITTICSATQNYTTSLETWWINVLAVDLTNPNINLTYPENTSYDVVQTALNYTVSDNQELDKCWYSINEGVLNTTINCGDNITGLDSGQGSLTWTIYANDTSGNENLSSVTFFVDSVVPEIQFVEPTLENNSIVSDNFIKINVTATDDNLDSIVIKLYNSTHDEINSSNTTSSPNYIKFSDLSAGIYYYNATVNDTVNNQNFTETREINLTIPTLTINKPKNETYLANTSLALKYTANYEDAVWYNLDFEENTTVTSTSYFNTSKGSHTLYLYANNSVGTATRNVTFFVNLTQFIIHFDEYDDTFEGNSTNFNEYSEEDMQNLSDIVLENIDSGKIKFNDAINLTDDANVIDNELDLDTHINISDNRIEINSTALPNFNTNATLYLYNLTFSTPRILKDNVVCPSSICTQQSYSGGTLIFNVTGFTVYSTEETPTAVVILSDPSGGAGPSGGKSAECFEDSDCEADEICWKSMCVQLFDIKIIDFESPAQLGDFFNFTYFAKGMAEINADVEVRFWIEKNQEVITSGSDIMYFGSFEEKTETTKIFLPSNLEPGVYEFYVKVIHEAYVVSAHRSIEIEVKEDGIAIITPLDEKYSKIYLIFVLIIVFLFILFLIHILRKKRFTKIKKKSQKKRK